MQAAETAISSDLKLSQIVQPTRILPDLQASVLWVRREINGNFILLGIIGFVQVPQLPITAHKICLFNRWTAGFGTFTEATFDRSGPDDGDAPERVKFALQDASHNATNVTVFGQVTFKRKAFITSKSWWTTS